MFCVENLEVEKSSTEASAKNPFALMPNVASSSVVVFYGRKTFERLEGLAQFEHHSKVSL